MEFTQGNLLDADVEAVVNTVNTVGVMGKGIALMFKEKFPDNFKEYAAACKNGEVKVGEMFATQNPELTDPKWIINFPTKEHWRTRTKEEWVSSGLVALRNFIEANKISSVAIPSLGCGNGGLSWEVVKPMIEEALGDLADVNVVVYEPTTKYQNVVKKGGVEALSPARAMVAELVRRYEVLGFDCTIIEIQKMSWFLERYILKLGIKNPLKFHFSPNRYGPSSLPLMKLLEKLDGSYLRSDKRITDAAPLDRISFKAAKREKVSQFLDQDSETTIMRPALEQASALIEGFESPLGLEALATVDWLISQESVKVDLESLREGVANWPFKQGSGERKAKVFNDRMLEISIAQLREHGLIEE